MKLIFLCSSMLFIQNVFASQTPNAAPPIQIIAPALFNYKLHQIDQSFLAQRQYFTKLGWQAYVQAHQKAQTLETLKSQGLMAYAHITGPIQNDQPDIFLIPMKVIYASPSEEWHQTFLLRLSMEGNKIRSTKVSHLESYILPNRPPNCRDSATH